MSSSSPSTTRRDSDERTNTKPATSRSPISDIASNNSQSSPRSAHPVSPNLAHSTHAHSPRGPPPPHHHHHHHHHHRPPQHPHAHLPLPHHHGGPPPPPHHLHPHPQHPHLYIPPPPSNNGNNNNPNSPIGSDGEPEVHRKRKRKAIEDKAAEKRRRATGRFVKVLANRINGPPENGLANQLEMAAMQMETDGMRIHQLQSEKRVLENKLQSSLAMQGSSPDVATRIRDYLENWKPFSSSSSIEEYTEPPPPPPPPADDIEMKVEEENSSHHHHRRRRHSKERSGRVVKESDARGSARAMDVEEEDEGESEDPLSTPSPKHLPNPLPPPEKPITQIPRGPAPSQSAHGTEFILRTASFQGQQQQQGGPQPPPTSSTSQTSPPLASYHSFKSQQHRLPGIGGIGGVGGVGGSFMISLDRAHVLISDLHRKVWSLIIPDTNEMLYLILDRAWEILLNVRPLRDDDLGRGTLAVYAGELAVCVEEHMRGRWHALDRHLSGSIHSMSTLLELIHRTMKEQVAGPLDENFCAEMVTQIRREHREFITTSISSTYVGLVFRAYGSPFTSVEESAVFQPPPPPPTPGTSPTTPATSVLPGLVERLGAIMKLPALWAVYCLKHGIVHRRIVWDHVGGLKGEAAVRVMDMLQLIIWFHESALDLSSKCSDWLLRLHEKSGGQVPSLLFRSGAELISDQPVNDGSGESMLYQGLLEGKLVAVKVCRIGGGDAGLEKAFHHEAVVWMQLKHPNIIPFYGVGKNDELFSSSTSDGGSGGRLSMLSPWMSNGNIGVYLKGFPRSSFTQLMTQAASGLAYLHSIDPPLLHGNLKGPNILINHRHEACLTDLGLHRFTEIQQKRQQPTTTNGLRWKAPEMVYSSKSSSSSSSRSSTSFLERHTCATDVYAFGMTMYEVFTRQIPFSHLKDDASFMSAVVRGERPPRPTIVNEHTSVMPLDIWNLVVACWEHDPKMRPPAEDVKNILLKCSG